MIRWVRVEPGEYRSEDGRLQVERAGRTLVHEEAEDAGGAC